MAVPPLPAPRPNQAYCDVAALEGGVVTIPCIITISTALPHETLTAPALSFLLTHSISGNRIVFDLGIRKDWETSLPPHFAEKVRDAMGFEMHIPLDIVEV